MTIMVDNSPSEPMRSSPTAIDTISTFVGKLKKPILAVLLPLAFIAIWHFSTYGAYSLIPPPSDVAVALYDLAFGGIYDDAYSNTLLTHVLASLGRVFGALDLDVYSHFRWDC